MDAGLSIEWNLKNADIYQPENFGPPLLTTYVIKTWRQSRQIPKITSNLQD